MVVNQLSEEAVDRMFQALADVTRRDIVRRVSQAHYSVSGLAALYSMSFAAVQKHVAVLERAHLVTKEKKGREQLVTVNPAALQNVRHLLEDYEALWRQRTASMATLLAELGPAETPAKELRN